MSDPVSLPQGILVITPLPEAACRPPRFSAERQAQDD